MYARPGLGRRSAPFVGVMILAIAVLPLPPAGDGLTEILRLDAHRADPTVWLAPWHRLPAFAEVVPALSYFVVVALLRESQGGALSGYSVLAMLPVFCLRPVWARDQLAIGIAGLGCSVLRAAPPARRSRVPVDRVADRDPLDLCRADRRPQRQALVAEPAHAEETHPRARQHRGDRARQIGASTDPGAVRQAVCVSARSIAGADVVQLLEPTPTAGLR